MAGDQTPFRQSSSSRGPSLSHTGSCEEETSLDHAPATEATPLLPNHDQSHSEYAAVADTPGSRPGSRLSLCSPGELRKAGWSHWPLRIALIALSVAIVLILIAGFAAPAAVKQYAQAAAVFEPTNLGVVSLTSTGVLATIQGNLVLDASRVKTPFVRGVGRLATFIATEVESGETDVHVYLPEHGNLLLGTATIPSVKVYIRNGHVNDIDLTVELRAGNMSGIREVVNDWLQGRLHQLRVSGIATVPLRSGILDLGPQTISESFVLQDQDLPNFPEVDISKLNIHEVTIPGGEKAMAVGVSASIMNTYPLNLTLPGLGFEVIVPNCSPSDEYILVAIATTQVVDIEPRKPIVVNVSGVVRKLPDALTTACPGSKTSPLDNLVGRYINGEKATIYIRGGNSSSPDVPEWIDEFLKSTLVPIPLSGHSLEGAVKNFSMVDMHFYLPDPFAEPGTPGAKPKVSCVGKAVIDLPKEMNFAINIPRMRALPKIYYEGNDLGYIDLQEWQKTNVTGLDDSSGDSPMLLITFDIHKAPLEVTDEDTFTSVIQALLFDHRDVSLNVTASVDAEIGTALGQFVVRDIPAKGNILVKTPAKEPFPDFMPAVKSVSIVDTTKSTVIVSAEVNFTNPTNYTATIPYVDIILAYNGTNVAHLSASHLQVVPGNNSAALISALWDPLGFGGPQGVKAGRELLSRFVSGYNVTVELKVHEGTVPAVPNLGRALSRFKVDMLVPAIRLPSNGDDEDDGSGPNFIKVATMHLWSSTAVFTLQSPLSDTILFITSINATALYNHTDEVSLIKYDLPFAVPPGTSQTPRIPVQLLLGGAGYDALKNALGGTLKLDAFGDIGVRLGDYVNTLFFEGAGISTGVQL